jgi:hypothetical protein
MCIVITSRNYHDLENKRTHFSASQWRSWCECEAKTLAYIRGDWKQPETEALLVGSYVDRALTAPDELEAWVARHKDDVFGKKGDKSAAFRKADKMIERVKKDEMWQRLAKIGKFQEVLTGKIGGTDWAYMADVLVDDPAIAMLLDFKTCADFDEEWMLTDGNKWQKGHWIDAAGYWRQLAIGRELFIQKYGYAPVCGIIASKKPATDDKEVGLGMWVMDNEVRLGCEIGRIEELLHRIIAVKACELPPTKCGRCEYCLSKSSFSEEQVAVSGRSYTA